MQNRPGLDLPLLHQQLAACSIGHRIDIYDRVPSTMPIAHSLARQPDITSGTLVVAEEQTTGRGRLQRSWETPFGAALLASVILKTPHLPANPRQIPMLAGLAVQSAIAATCPECNERVGMKWPNDILLGPDPDRGIWTAGKVAGILVETAYFDGTMTHAVLGIGINVNQQESQLPSVANGALPPTSLSLFAGRKIDRTALLIALCQQIEHYALAIAPNELFEQWRASLHTLGLTVAVKVIEDGTASELRGVARDVTEDGDLILKDDDGVEHHVSVGDVMSVRTPWGE